MLIVLSTVGIINSEQHVTLKKQKIKTHENNS